MTQDRPDIAVAVLSCDKYSDLWPAFFDLYFRNWEGLNLPTYLCANEKVFPDSRVSTVLSGEDLDWSSSIKASLEQIPNEYVFVFFDDVFFDQKINKHRVAELLDFVSQEQPTYLRFREPKPDERISKKFGRIREDTIYRTSIFALWKTRDLLDLLRAGESAWEFEYLSPDRARSLSGFYGVYEEYFSYIHGIEKGLWIKDAQRRVLDLGAAVDVSSRRVMTDDEDRRYKAARRRERIFNATPARFRPTLINAKRRLSRLIGGTT